MAVAVMTVVMAMSVLVVVVVIMVVITNRKDDILIMSGQGIQRVSRSMLMVMMVS